MAVARQNESTEMLIRVEIGDGDDVSYKNRTLKYIAPNTTDETFRGFAVRIGNLQKKTVNGYIRRDTAYLVEE